MQIYNNIGEIIGHTPLIRLHGIEKELGLFGKLIVKYEAKNPAGSAKDRVAKYIIDAAREAHKLGDGAVIIEPTSGNTGIGIAALGAALGYKIIIVMPENMSGERKMLIRAYGAELVLTDAALGMAGAIAKAEELQREIPNSIIAGQFTNPENPRAHRKTTGPEIYDDTDGQVDIFVAGVGTGGTITGVGEFLKRLKPECKIVGVEPKGSPVLSGGTAGAHGIQGIGAGFVPEILNRDVIDEVVTVTEEDAKECARLLARCDGILAGISSGAALYAGIKEAKCEKNLGKMIVVLLPDSGERYLSCGLFD